MQDFFLQNDIPIFEDEEWKSIDGYDDKYFVSNYGRVLSFKRK